MKHQVWTENDTYAALFQFTALFVADEYVERVQARTINAQQEAHDGCFCVECEAVRKARRTMTPAERQGVFSGNSKQAIAGNIVYFAKVFSNGNITTDNFLRVVKDIVGGA